MCNLCRMNICLVSEITFSLWFILYQLTVKRPELLWRMYNVPFLSVPTKLASKMYVNQLFVFVQNVISICDQYSTLKSCSAILSLSLHFRTHQTPLSTKYDGVFVLNSNTKVPCIVTVLNWISFCTRSWVCIMYLVGIFNFDQNYPTKSCVFLKGIYVYHNGTLKGWERKE